MVNYSRIIGGAPMRIMNPSMIMFLSGGVSEKAYRLDLVVLELVLEEKVFHRHT